MPANDQNDSCKQQYRDGYADQCNSPGCHVIVDDASGSDVLRGGRISDRISNVMKSVPDHQLSGRTVIVVQSAEGWYLNVAPPTFVIFIQPSDVFSEYLPINIEAMTIRVLDYGPKVLNKEVLRTEH